ncbi:MAG: hypothetical protein ACLU38_05175 [Dysosmobacter sp.]
MSAGHSCGQSRFCAAFGNQEKSLQHAVSQGFAAFRPHPIPDTTTALPNQARYQLRYTGYSALPLYHGEGRKAKLFLAAVIYVHCNTYWTSEKSYEGYGSDVIKLNCRASLSGKRDHTIPHGAREPDCGRACILGAMP